MRTRAESGFTLPELLIAVTVLAVMMAVGLPNFTEFVRNQRVKTASFDLFSSLIYARSEAITRNASVKVEPVGGDWASGWTIKDAGGNVLKTLDKVGGNMVIDGPLSVEFRGSGRLNAASMPQFQLAAAGVTVTKRCIKIDLSGRPNSKAAAC